LALVLHRALLCLTLGVFFGALYVVASRPVRKAYADGLMTAAALGIPLWGLINVVALPVFAGQTPEWNAE
jgi:predicted MFS family arabinose efflux permease